MNRKRRKPMMFFQRCATVHEYRSFRRTVAAAFLVCACAAVPVESEERIRFPDLPDTIRGEILTGAPRMSHEILASPFGIHTTLLRERGRADAEYQEELVRAIVEAGYKWVVDYISYHDVKDVATADLPAAVQDLIPPMVQYAALLRAHGVNLIIRIDMPHWKAGPKKPPTAEEEIRARAFLEPVIRSLSPYCRHWQYHNEPNFPSPDHTRPHSPPEAYVAWLHLVEEIVREVQPDAVYSGPALAMLQAMEEKPYPWLRLAFEAGLADSLDQFTYHPYRMPWEVAYIPERPSGWTGEWDTYYSQVHGLKAMIRKHSGRDIPLVVTEDGLATDITAAGEQEFSWVIEAKYELRRMLLDHWLGVYPRTTFILYRDLDWQHYEFQAAFNMVTRDMDKKPAYYAAQNLMAVLDGTYERDNRIDIQIDLETPPDEGTAKPVRTEADAAVMEKGGMEGLYIQTYTKSHEAFDELLVFYWSAEPGGNKHVRRKATLTLRDPGWTAPLEIDLMAMPNPRLAKKQAGKEGLINPDSMNRLQPRPLEAVLADGSSTLNGIEVRDYPLLIKWVKLSP
jgi:hypothetical protein